MSRTGYIPYHVVLQDDALSRRFAWALGGSVLANVALWLALSTGANRVVVPPAPPVLVFERVTIDKQSKPHEQIIKPKDVQKKVQKAVEPKERPVQPPPPPPGAHTRVITAKGKDPSQDGNTALSGGNAKLGAPTIQQVGNATTNTPTPPPPVPPPTQQPQPAPPQPEPAKPTPPPPPTPAPPPPAPAPKGPTTEAVATHMVDVEIPDSLKNESFKSFVRVTVDISAEGSFDVVLRTSSGNPDVDKLVLDTLKKWKWRPAQKDGVPVDSVQKFRFDFEVK